MKIINSTEIGMIFHTPVLSESIHIISEPSETDSEVLGPMFYAQRTLFYVPENILNVPRTLFLIQDSVPWNSEPRPILLVVK